MERFKKGDKVRVRIDLEPNKSYEDGVCFIPRMKDFIGKVLTIKSYSHYRYEVEENTWNWPESMFELFETTEERKMKIEDIKKKNLVEAKKQFEEIKKNEEIEFAKKQLTMAINEIDSLDREIKQLQKQKKPYEEIIAKFE